MPLLRLPINNLVVSLTHIQSGKMVENENEKIKIYWHSCLMPDSHLTSTLNEYKKYSTQVTFQLRPTCGATISTNFYAENTNDIYVQCPVELGLMVRLIPKVVSLRQMCMRQIITEVFINDLPLERREEELKHERFLLDIGKYLNSSFIWDEMNDKIWKLYQGQQFQHCSPIVLNYELACARQMAVEEKKFNFNWRPLGHRTTQNYSYYQINTCNLWPVENIHVHLGVKDMDKSLISLELNYYLTKNNEEIEAIQQRAQNYDASVATYALESN